MTDSPWKIPESWTWTTTGEIARIVGGGTPRTDDSTNFENGDIPWITPADLSGYKEKFISRGNRNITKHGLENSGACLMPQGTVLFSLRAPIGYVAIASNPVSTNQGFKSFLLPSAIFPDYAYYYLQRARQLAVDLSSGTTFQEISGAKAALIPFAVAPPKEQRRIVGEIEKQFTRLDAAVAALKRVQANLKRYRAAVLKAACEGRLVPTEAELARRERRSYEPASALLERILRERRTRWEATQLAAKKRYKTPEKINESDPLSGPGGWTYATLDQLTSKIVDGTHFTPTYVPNGVPFLSVKDVHDDSVSFEDCKFIPRKEHELLSKRCNPEKGDLLVTKSGTIGRSAVIEVDTEFSLF